MVIAEKGKFPFVDEINLNTSKTQSDFINLSFTDKVESILSAIRYEKRRNFG